MSKPTSIGPAPEHLDHTTSAQWLDKWDEYAQIALKGCLAFHGADASSADSGVTHIALIADQMMAARMERVMGIKDTQEMVKEQEKTDKAKSPSISKR